MDPDRAPRVDWASVMARGSKPTDEDRRVVWLAVLGFLALLVGGLWLVATVWLLPLMVAR